MGVSNSATKPAPEWLFLSTGHRSCQEPAPAEASPRSLMGLALVSGRSLLGQSGTGFIRHSRSFWQLLTEPQQPPPYSSLPKPGHTNLMQTKLPSSNSKRYLSTTRSAGTTSDVQWEAHRRRGDLSYHF